MVMFLLEGEFLDLMCVFILWDTADVELLSMMGIEGAIAHDDVPNSLEFLWIG